MRNIIAIRGATTSEHNSKESILEATEELLQETMRQNNLNTDALISIIFTGTPDLTAAFPAQAARRLGLVDVPLLGAQELDVVGAPEKCIRIMIHAQSSLKRNEVKHVYLRGAKVLRPDLIAGGSRDEQR